jgi:hypothetical protein
MDCTLALYVPEGDIAPNGIAYIDVDWDDDDGSGGRAREYVDVRADVKAWMKENIKEEWEIEFTRHSFQFYGDAGTYFEFHFGSEIDLIFFKMKWL